ncbi:MAG: SGNH/GDSL hydrolase family protein [Myxococcota bacterium]
MIILIFLSLEILLRLFNNPFYVSEKRLFQFRKDLKISEGKSGIYIAMLGDSFTYGVKVKDEETSSYQLERQLRERLAREDIYVDNLGIAGTSTIEQYVIFERVVKNSNYDFVILNFFIDDFTPYYYFNTLLNPYEYCREYLKSGGNMLGLLSMMRLFEITTIYYDIIKTYIKVGSPLTPVSYMLEKMRERDSLRYMCAKGRLIQMGEEIKNSGKRAIFLMIPSLTLYDYQNPYPEEIAKYETEAMLIAKGAGFEVIDTVVELRDKLDQRLIVKNDIHLNKDGYRLIAELIADKIIALMKR